MGLDQYAYIKPDGDNDVKPRFVWRKYSKLQSFMEDLFVERTGQGITTLNCGELDLEAVDIDRLETAVKKRDLPHCNGGFFTVTSSRTMRRWKIDNWIWNSAPGRGTGSRRVRPSSIPAGGRHRPRAGRADCVPRFLCSGCFAGFAVPPKRDENGGLSWVIRVRVKGVHPGRSDRVLIERKTHDEDANLYRDAGGSEQPDAAPGQCAGCG